MNLTTISPETKNFIVFFRNYQCGIKWLILVKVVSGSYKIRVVLITIYHVSNCEKEIENFFFWISLHYSFKCYIRERKKCVFIHCCFLLIRLPIIHFPCEMQRKNDLVNAANQWQKCRPCPVHCWGERWSYQSDNYFR